MRLTSAAFEEGAAIPEQHAKNAANVSPPLAWTDAPAGTKSFALAMIDRISPGNVYVHWLVADIPAGTSSLEEGAAGASRMPAGREIRPYAGPFPPSGTHTYEFTLYALDTERLVLPNGADLPAFEGAVGKALASARLRGTFTKTRT